MTAHLYRDKHCWLVDNDPWESPHFDNGWDAVRFAEQEHADRLAEDPHWRGVRAEVRQELHLCWIRVCAHDGCDVEEIDDDFDEPVHYPQADPPSEFKCEDHRERQSWEVFVVANESPAPSV